MQFDPSAVLPRLQRMWGLATEFGVERNALRIYLREIVSDRYVLVNGLQLLRDELQFAGRATDAGDMAACGVDLTLPTVCTTVACTNCGDRIHQGETESAYRQAVAGRFATLSEIGDLKVESFSPTGGGTDDGATFAHVTIAHQLDEPLRIQLYEGHAQSFVLGAFDLRTHVGRLKRLDGHFEFGVARESDWREARAACGAIVGALKSFRLDNPVHVRLRRDLGENNFEYLRSHPIKSADGVDVTAAVAAAIISVQGMLNTAQALTTELDERGVAHLTASTTVNRVSQNDNILYLARASVFHGELKVQGFGTDARKFTAKMIDHASDDMRLQLIYDGRDPEHYPITSSEYEVRPWQRSANH